ncbi:MAG: hypothetical protein GX640_00405 [Fibrobacter sp.]|nr:hypothetical protein [Fibrobacter sp.]
MLTNAHNEWFNIMINEGILGLAAYAGFFLSSAVAFLKNEAKEVLYPAVAGSILAYMAHNIFCYQQVMCTPFLFILIGVGSSYLRNEKKLN